MKILIVLAVLVVVASSQDSALAPRSLSEVSPVSPREKAKTFHHCTSFGGSANSPHLFDYSEIYQCDEGKIELAGVWSMTIEHGYVYESDMGKPGILAPRPVTKEDYADYKWCAGANGTLERCGVNPTKCWDGKPGTWDPGWQGYSCVRADSYVRDDDTGITKEPSAITETPEPEPIDVPAIKKRHGIQVQIETGCDPLPDGTHGKNGNECHVLAAPKIPSPDDFTCKAGSHRILLQDVDGDWHCLKFSQKSVN